MDTQHDFSRSLDVHEQMHNLFVLALLSSHPDPESVRGQFRTLLNGLAAAHSRYVFGDDFVVSIRRSILRFDRMLRMVLAARHATETAVSEAEAPPEPVGAADGVAAVDLAGTAAYAVAAAPLDDVNSDERERPASDREDTPPPELAPAAHEAEPRVT